MSEVAVSDAWLLHLNGGARAAIGQREMLYVLPHEPRLHRVPLAPEHACHVLIWEHRLVPVVDAGLLISSSPLSTDAETTTLSSFQKLIAIVAVCDADETQASLGALLLCAMPERIAVSDDSACDLSEELSKSNRMVCACFRATADSAPVPILDLAAIFGPNRGDYQHGVVQRRALRDAPGAHIGV